MDPNQNPTNPPTPNIPNPPLDPSLQQQSVQPQVDAQQPSVSTPAQPELTVPQPSLEQPTPPVVQQPQQFGEQPVVAQPQPVAQQSVVPAPPQQTFTPAPVAGQPVQPPVQPGVVNGYSAQPGYPTMPPIAASSGGKLGGIRQKLGIVLSVGAVLITAAVFAINSGIFAKGVALTEYSNDSYSIMVPEDYEKDDAYDTQVEFKKKDSPSGSEPSTLLIFKQDLYGGDASEAKETIEEGFTEDLIKEEFSSSATIKDFKKESTKHKGSDAFRMSATVEENSSSDEKAKGSVVYYVVYDDEAIYMLTLFANGNDHGFSKQFDKIIDSFTVKS